MKRELQRASECGVKDSLCQSLLVWCRAGAGQYPGCQAFGIVERYFRTKSADPAIRITLDLAYAGEQLDFTSTLVAHRKQ
jgi:hypothetical protein